MKWDADAIGSSCSLTSARSTFYLWQAYVTAQHNDFCYACLRCAENMIQQWFILVFGSVTKRKGNSLFGSSTVGNGVFTVAVVPQASDCAELLTSQN